MAPPGNQAANGESKLKPVAMGRPSLLDKPSHLVAARAYCLKMRNELYHHEIQRIKLGPFSVSSGEKGEMFFPKAARNGPKVQDLRQLDMFHAN